MTTTETPVAGSVVRVRIFVDFWNFEISMRELGLYSAGYKVDWRELGPSLARLTGELVDPAARAVYRGMNVYGSYDPNSPQDDRMRHWLSNIVSTFPGVSAILRPRRPRGFPRCPSCHAEVRSCPACDASMRGSEEKAVDTRIATDMISLAWDGNYDVAVLVSSDRDFVPVAEFLASRGLIVVHGAFPPNAAELTQACWGSLNIPAIREQFRRA